MVNIIRYCWLIYDGLLSYIIKIYVNFADSSSLENHTAFSQLLLDQRMWEGLSIFKFQQRLADVLTHQFNSQNAAELVDRVKSIAKGDGVEKGAITLMDSVVGAVATDISLAANRMVNIISPLKSNTAAEIATSVSNTTIHDFIVALYNAYIYD